MKSIKPYISRQLVVPPKIPVERRLEGVKRSADGVVALGIERSASPRTLTLVVECRVGESKRGATRVSVNGGDSPITRMSGSQSQGSAWWVEHWGSWKMAILAKEPLGVMPPRCRHVEVGSNVVESSARPRAFGSAQPRSTAPRAGVGTRVRRSKGHGDDRDHSHQDVALNAVAISVDQGCKGDTDHPGARGDRVAVHHEPRCSISKLNAISILVLDSRSRRGLVRRSPKRRRGFPLSRGVGGLHGERGHCQVPLPSAFR